MMDAQTYYHYGRRIDGEYASVEQALAGLGLSRKKARAWAGRYDRAAQCLMVPKPGGWFAVVGKGGRFKLYDVVKTHCTNRQEAEFFCQTLKALAGGAADVICFADMPNAKAH